MNMSAEELSEVFYDAIWQGQAKLLASAIRNLHPLDFEKLDTLADLLGSDDFARKFYPYRLKFSPRLKKKAKPQLGDSFIQAVFAGDAAQVVSLLRSADFTPGKAMVLADLLDSGPADHKSYPYRLQFARWGRGRPFDFTKNRAARFTEFLMFSKELQTEKKNYLAVENLMKRTGKGRSTTMANLAKSKSPRS